MSWRHPSRDSRNENGRTRRESVMEVRSSLVIAGAALAIYLAGSAILLRQRRIRQDLPTASAAFHDMEIKVLASGVIYPKHLVSVGAQVSGQIKRIAVTLGEGVKLGQVIAEIDSAPQLNAIAKDETSLEMTKALGEGLVANAELALLNFNRQASLAQRHYTPKQDLDNARIALDVARANVKSNRAQVKAAQLALDLDHLNFGYTTIRAPMDGTVTSIAVEEGQTVNAAQTIPKIATLADLRKMTVKARLSEADVNRVRPGARVFFKILGSEDRNYTSFLSSIDPAPEDTSLQTDGVVTQAAEGSSSPVKPITYDARFDVDNTDGSLRPFMTAEVFVVVQEVQHALVIPSAAVTMLTKDYGTVVVRSAMGAQSTRSVHTGVSDDFETQVIDGLSEGQQVLLPKP